MTLALGSCFRRNDGRVVPANHPIASEHWFRRGLLNLTFVHNAVAQSAR